VAEDKEPFLNRWSRLKREAPVEKPAETPRPNLPPVEQLTPESDFSAFMHPKVEDALRRVALKKMFSGDPHFNLPDPFEPNSRDWNISDPIPDEMMKTLNQARTLLFSDEERQKLLAEEELAKQEAELAKQAAAQASQAAEAPAAEQPKNDEPGKQDA
jgi:hypothetical protein